MTSVNDNEIKHQDWTPDMMAALDSYQTPQTSDLLQARILKTARNTPQDERQDIPQNIAKPRVAPIRLLQAMAACLCVVISLGLWTSHMSATQYEQEADIWLNAANDMDMSDIYTWVETGIDVDG